MRALSAVAELLVLISTGAMNRLQLTQKVMGPNTCRLIPTKEIRTAYFGYS